MTLYYGAKSDLERCVDTHLFLICPNNSGSTYLMNVLKTSRHIWSLVREGQHVLGYAGPYMRATERPLLWGADDAIIQRFMDPANYDWAKTKRAWYFQASARRADAPVFATKAPPFLLFPDMLAAHFANVKFLFMVRDPYAAIEGILRRRKRLGLTLEEASRMAAEHMVTCFTYQRRNLVDFADRSTFFTYETLCADPEGVARQIKGLVPVLDDLQLSQRVAVKGMYDEPLRNMNDDQIARLEPAAFDAINRVFERHAGLIDGFGYALRSG